MKIVKTKAMTVTKGQFVRGGVYEGTGNHKLYLAAGMSNGDLKIIDLESGYETSAALTGEFIKVEVEVHFS